MVVGGGVALVAAGGDADVVLGAADAAAGTGLGAGLCALALWAA